MLSMDGISCERITMVTVHMMISYLIFAYFDKLIQDPGLNTTEMAMSEFRHVTTSFYVSIPTNNSCAGGHNYLSL